MAAPDPTQIERLPGVLIQNPTNLNTPPYYGGVPLGSARMIAVEFIDNPSVNYAEEYKGAPVDILEGSEWCVLYGTLREFTKDAIRAIFAHTRAGVVGEVIDGGVNVSPRAGESRAARSYKIMFAPNEITQPGLIIYNAVPVIVEGNRTALTIFRENVLSVSWMSMPDGSKRTYKLGPIQDLAL